MANVEAEAVDFEPEDDDLMDEDVGDASPNRAIPRLKSAIAGSSASMKTKGRGFRDEAAAESERSARMSGRFDTLVSDGGPGPERCRNQSSAGIVLHHMTRKKLLPSCTELVVGFSVAKVGGGVLCCPGFHSSLRATQSGLYLNFDLSTTMIYQLGPVLDFLNVNQNVSHYYLIDWEKAKRTLHNLRVSIKGHIDKEYKITGLSEKPCRNQTSPRGHRSRSPRRRF